MLKGIPPKTAAEISQALAHLVSATPAAFEWRNTSIGNLILAGRYCQFGDWGPALTWAHSAVSACGAVMPVSTERADLGARLANGRCVLVQGIVPALAASPAPKVLLLNPFTDAETMGK